MSRWKREKTREVGGLTGLDATRGLGFALASGARERIDLVDEDDGRLRFSCHREELLDKPVGGAREEKSEARTEAREGKG